MFKKLCVALLCLAVCACVKKGPSPRDAKEANLMVSAQWTSLSDLKFKNPIDALSAAFPGAEPVYVSRYPSDVGYAVIEGKPDANAAQQIGATKVSVQAKGNLYGGKTLPVEHVACERIRRDKDREDLACRGYSFGLEIDPGKDVWNLTTSLWFSAVNNPVWSSERDGLIAKDAKVPKVLNSLTTPVKPGHTAVFLVMSPSVDPTATGLLTVTVPENLKEGK